MKIKKGTIDAKQLKVTNSGNAANQNTTFEEQIDDFLDSGDASVGGMLRKIVNKVDELEKKVEKLSQPSKD